MFETFGLEHPLSWLLGDLRLARVLMFAFAVVSYVGICACALVLRFALGFNVNGRQWPLMVVNVFFLGYGADRKSTRVNSSHCD